WHLAEAYPHLFSAIIPICGGTRPMIGFPEKIKVLKDTPIWVFHGAKDDVVPLKNSQDLVDVLTKQGGKR
ncbi:MAG: phospholipase, partial [Candidatus Bathyarchaeia archaeon]